MHPDDKSFASRRGFFIFQYLYTSASAMCKSAIIADLSPSHQCLTVYKDQTWQKPHEI
jgi:hypothetical protein